MGDDHLSHSRNDVGRVRPVGVGSAELRLVEQLSDVASGCQVAAGNQKVERVDERDPVPRRHAATTPRGDRLRGPTYLVRSLASE